MYSPRTRSRYSRWRSSSSTSAPPRARTAAIDEPAIPAPTTTTSGLPARMCDSSDLLGHRKSTSSPPSRHRTYQPSRDGPIGPSPLLSVRQSQQPGARGARGSRGAGGQPQLRQDVRHMPMHGMRADHEALGNLGIAEALSNKHEHLSLARAELTQHLGIRLAGRGGCLDAKERGDGAQDRITVAMPRQVGVTRQ